MQLIYSYDTNAAQTSSLFDAFKQNLLQEFLIFHIALMCFELQEKFLALLRSFYFAHMNQRCLTGVIKQRILIEYFFWSSDQIVFTIAFLVLKLSFKPLVFKFSFQQFVPQAYAFLTFNISISKNIGCVKIKKQRTYFETSGYSH